MWRRTVAYGALNGAKAYIQGAGLYLAVWDVSLARPRNDILSLAVTQGMADEPNAPSAYNFTGMILQCRMVYHVAWHRYQVDR